MERFYNNINSDYSTKVEYYFSTTLPMIDPKFHLRILGLLVAMPGYYSLAYLLYMIVKPDPDNPWGALIYTFSQLVGFIILLQVAKRENGGFRSIYIGGLGLREVGLTISLWFIAFILWLPINYILSYLNIPLSRWGYSIQGFNVIPVAIWALGAAFFEEAFFRGYTLTRLPKIINNTTISVIISVLAFSAIHLRFGLGLFIYIIVWASIISILFLITKSTWSCFLYHAINNIIVDFIIYGK
jgi:membrane protease YdiL (CAAX protease family)